MNIPNNIKFDKLNTTLFVRKGDKEYDSLKKMNNDGNWTNYINEMLVNQTSIRYDYSTDTFTVVPLFRSLTETYNLGVEEEYIDEVEIGDILSNVLPNAIEKGIENAFNKLKNDMYSGVNFDSIEVDSVNDVNKTALKKNIDWEEEIEIDKPNDYVHPDLERLTGIQYNGIKPKEEEYEDLIIGSDKFSEFEENDKVFNNCHETIDLDGKPIQIVLNNIYIKNSEVQFINSLAKETGGDLKGLNGNSDLLEIYFEAPNKKVRVIECIDKRNIHLPFSCNGRNFKELKEAFNYATTSTDDFKKEVKKSKLNEAVFSRGFNSEKEATIFDFMKETKININESWVTMDLGYVNLKNGYNEKLRNIIKLDNNQNTLMENSNGHYVLIKGNLKERSKNGLKKELIKENSNKKESLGTYRVVGLFENSLEGLGEIMYKTKKGEVRLLCWK